MIAIPPVLFAVLSAAMFLISFFLLTGMSLRAFLGDFFYLFRISRKKNFLLLLTGVGLFVFSFLYLLGIMLSPLGRALVLHLELLGVILLACKKFSKGEKNE